jgi:probable HAF family extracellular repeat protein
MSSILREFLKIQWLRFQIITLVVWLMSLEGFCAAYRITPLGNLGGTQGSPSAINDQGDIVGSSTLADDFFAHAYLSVNGNLTDLDPQGISSHAADISNNGAIVGAFRRMPTRSFMYSGGTISDLGAPPGAFNGAEGINNAGTIVGWIASAGMEQAYAYSEGTFKPLGTLGGSRSRALAINDQGQIVGYARTSGEEQHAFLYRDGQMIDLNIGGTESSADDINNQGQIVGTVFKTSLDPRAFFYDEGTLVDIASGRANAINNLSQVVGSSTHNRSRPYAFLYENGVLTDLNTLLPVSSGWELLNAQDINNAGQIVGTGVYGGIEIGYVLSPVAPETIPDSGPTVCLLAAASTFLFAGRRAVILALNRENLPSGGESCRCGHWSGQTRFLELRKSL